MDRSIGPYENGQEIALIVGNIGILIWVISQSFMTSAIITQATRLFNQVDGNDQAKHNVGAIVDYLKTVEKKNRSVIFLAFVFYITASVPYFWVYQQYFMLSLLSLAHLSGNMGMIYLQTSAIQNNEATTAANFPSDSLPFFKHATNCSIKFSLLETKKKNNNKN